MHRIRHWMLNAGATRKFSCRNPFSGKGDELNCEGTRSKINVSEETSDERSSAVAN